MTEIVTIGVFFDDEKVWW